MSPVAERLLAEIKRLPPGERLFIAETCETWLEHPDTELQGAIDAAWDVELRQRMDDLDSGRAELLDGDTVMRELREKYGLPPYKGESA